MIDRAAERTESGEKDDESRQQTDHTFLFFHISHQRAEPACTSAREINSRGRFFIIFMR